MKGHIKLDLSDVIQEFALSKKQGENLCKTVLKAVSEEVANKWRKIASKELKSTRSNYIRSIVVVEEGRLKNSIVLKGEFNNNIESGIGSYDMKKFFQKSSKVKMSSKGKWYLRIPFRLATPGSIGESEAFSGTMPKEIMEAVNKNTAQKTDIGGGKSGGKGLTKDQIPAKFRDVITKKDRKGFSDYTHKSSIYEGVFKSEKFGEKGKGGQYTSIRTAGEASDSSSWIHPGIKAHNFAEKALKSADIDTLVNNTTDKFLASL